MHTCDAHVSHSELCTIEHDRRKREFRRPARAGGKASEEIRRSTSSRVSSRRGSLRIATLFRSHRLLQTRWGRSEAFVSACRLPQDHLVTAGTIAEVPASPIPSNGAPHLVAIEVGLLDPAVFEGDLARHRDPP